MGFNSTIDWIANGKKKSAGPVDESNVSSLSIPKQTKIYIEKLKQISSQKGNKLFEFSEMNQVARGMNLQVGDFR